MTVTEKTKLLLLTFPYFSFFYQCRDSEEVSDGEIAELLLQDHLLCRRFDQKRRCLAAGGGMCSSSSPPRCSKISSDGIAWKLWFFFLFCIFFSRSADLSLFGAELWFNLPRFGCRFYSCLAICVIESTFGKNVGWWRGSTFAKICFVLYCYIIKSASWSLRYIVFWEFLLLIRVLLCWYGKCLVWSGSPLSFFNFFRGGLRFLNVRDEHCSSHYSRADDG